MGTTWEAGEFVLGFGDLTDAVQEHFGTNAPDNRFAEIAFVGAVGFVGL